MLASAASATAPHAATCARHPFCQRTAHQRVRGRRSTSHPSSQTSNSSSEPHLLVSRIDRDHAQSQEDGNGFKGPLTPTVQAEWSKGASGSVTRSSPIVWYPVLISPEGLAIPSTPRGSPRHYDVDPTLVSDARASRRFDCGRGLTNWSAQAVEQHRDGCAIEPVRRMRRSVPQEMSELAAAKSGLGSASACLEIDSPWSGRRRLNGR